LFYDSTLVGFKFWNGTAWTTLGGGSGGAVASVFGRTGVVVATTNDYNFSQIGGTITISQQPATTVQAAGTVSANSVLKWVTSNTATSSSISDSGSAITTSEPITAAAFTGAATGLTAFPTGQFAASSKVSPITTGLIGEYHLNEASGATVAIDYSGNGNNGAYFGTPTLTGTFSGGMVSAGAGGMDYPTSFNTGSSQATTLSTYVCSNALATNGSTLPLLIGGLTGSATPTLSSLQAFGLMMNATNSNPLSSVVAIGKYDTTPAVYNDTTVPTVSSQSSDGCHLITLVRGTSSDILYIDGNAVSGYFLQGTGTLSLVPSTGSISLGMPHYATLPNAAFAYPYPVYFNFVFNRALTAAEVNTLAGSAQSYAQFRGIAKTPTTFTDPGNQILYIGDSITVAINTATPWSRTVTSTTNTAYIPVTAGLPGSANNIATPSWTIGNLIQECQSRGYGSMNPNSSTTAIIWAGTNDIATGTQVTPATAYGRLRRLVQCYKSGPHQPRVFVMTMLSRTGSGTGVNAGFTFDQLHDTYNNLIRKDYAGADGMIDIASFAGLGADGASTNPTLVCTGATACFQGDGIHPTSNAQSIIAGYVASYINWADAKNNGTNPTTITTATYQETAADIAITALPTAASTITLPTAVGLVGTERYIKNESAFTVTVGTSLGENIDNTTSVSCAANARCVFHSVLGATPGLPTPGSTAGAHWEQ
jgi:lysophospholipase L1-like esterase